MRVAIFTGAMFALAPFAAMAGDADAGADTFQRQCVACHIVQDADGETLAGRNARTGPNLYGVIGRQAGVVEGFRYGASMVEAGEAGLVWDEDSFVAYVQDPNGFLREVLDNRRARGQMSFQVRNPDDAANLYAFLATFSPVAEDAEADAIDQPDETEEAVAD